MRVTLDQLPRVWGLSVDRYLEATGAPREFEWALAGYGSITPQSAHTDARGVAGAVFVPVSAGDVVTITVTHGTAA